MLFSGVVVGGDVDVDIVDGCDVVVGGDVIVLWFSSSFYIP